MPDRTPSHPLAADGWPIHAARFAGGPILVESGSGAIHRLTEAGAIIWQAVTAGEPVGAVAEDLADAFGIPQERAEKDIAALIGHWRDLGWRWGEPAPRVAAPSPVPAATAPPEKAFDCHDYSLNGRPFRLCLAGDGMEHMRSVLAPWQQPGEGMAESVATVFRLFSDGGDGYSLFRDEAPLLEKGDIFLAKGTLFHAIAAHAYGAGGVAAVLHAGATSNGRGAVILAAESGRGKSTLSAALLSAGLLYCGDDFLPIRRGDFHVLPFPTALNLKSGSWPLFTERYPQLAALPTFTSLDRQVRFLPCPTPPAAGGYPACALVFPGYTPGARLQARPIPPDQALSRLSGGGAWLGPPPHDPAEIQRFLEWLEQLPAYELAHSDLDEAVAWIRVLFSA